MNRTARRLENTRPSLRPKDKKQAIQDAKEKMFLLERSLKEVEAVFEQGDADLTDLADDDK